MDFIAIDLHKHDVWDAFIQPVPIKAQMYLKTASYDPGSPPEDGCTGGIDDTECTYTNDQEDQETIGGAAPSTGGSGPDGGGYQPPGSNPGDGAGGGLTEEQIACGNGQKADRNRNEAAANARDAINERINNDGRTGEDQPEYAISGFFNDDGTVSSTEPAQGQSYTESNPPSTPIPFLSGSQYEVSDFAFILHSHGYTRDVNIQTENQAPSDSDWQIMDAFSNGGVDMEDFVMFIIDQNGTMRAYQYQTPAQREATSDDPRGNVDSTDAVSNNTVRECV